LIGEKGEKNENDLTIAIIAAVAKNGVIGKDTPFHGESRATSKSSWKTPWEHRPNGAGKPRVHRTAAAEQVNMVLTTKEDYFPEGCVIVHSLKDAVMVADPDKKLFVIGGAEVYREAFPYADELYLTEVNAEPEGDTKFPEWDRSQWEEHYTESETQGPKDEYPFIYREFRKKVLRFGQRQRGWSAGNDGENQCGGYCPFCMENLQKNHDRPIIFDGVHWIATENQWPYRRRNSTFSSYQKSTRPNSRNCRKERGMNFCPSQVFLRRSTA
jgi:dihydrofolate reductase